MVEPNACKGAAGSQQTTQIDYGTQPEMVNVGFFVEGGKPEHAEKNPCDSGENQQTN